MPPLPVTTLANGLRIVTDVMPSLRSTALSVWIKVGSRDEPAHQHGASHFLEHVLFKGTTARTSLEITKAVEDIGGDMNAFTAYEYTCFYARCMDRDQLDVLDVLCDMLTDSTIPEDEFESERNVVIEEIKMSNDRPAHNVYQGISQAVFGDHPIGLDIAGTQHEIETISRQHVLDWWKARYTPANIVVSIAGNVDHDTIVRAVDGRFGDAPSLPLERQAPPPGLHARSYTLDKPLEQMHVIIARPGLERNHPLRQAGEIVADTLGGGMSSRLFQEVREVQGLCYDVGTLVDMFDDTGMVGVTASTTPAKLSQLIEAIATTVHAYIKDGLSADELATAKASLIGHKMLGLEGSYARAMYAGRHLTNNSPLRTLDESIAAIEAVTLDDINDYVRATFAGEHAISLVGPLDSVANQLDTWRDGVTFG